VTKTKLTSLIIFGLVIALVLCLYSFDRRLCAAVVLWQAIRVLNIACQKFEKEEKAARP
jgi:hypothetical protein